MITMISFRSIGNWDKTFRFLQKNNPMRIEAALHKGGKMGVEALQAATPQRSGKTASSWTYEINKQGRGWRINWLNTHTNQGYNIAVLIQYGHGTGTGGYVQAVDYVNPAMHSVFKQIADTVWEEVTRE